MPRQQRSIRGFHKGTPRLDLRLRKVTDSRVTSVKEWLKKRRVSGNRVRQSLHNYRTENIRVLIKGKKLEREPKLQNSCLEIFTHGEGKEKEESNIIHAF